MNLYRNTKKQNIIYSEVKYLPHYLVSPNDKRSKDEIVESIIKGFKRGEKDFGVIVKSCMTMDNMQPGYSDELARLAIKYKTSLDIGCGETHFDDDKLHTAHVKAIQKGYDAKCPITIHAAESGPGKNVLIALKDYHATRIGHGYRILDHKENVEKLKGGNVHFEICPTSSFETHGWVREAGLPKWSTHPMVDMMNKYNFHVLSAPMILP
eukprot:UN34915